MFNLYATFTSLDSNSKWLILACVVAASIINLIVSELVGHVRQRVVIRQFRAANQFRAVNQKDCTLVAGRYYSIGQYRDATRQAG